MIRLIGKETSINVRKVLWCLDIIGCEYEHTNSMSEPDLKALNPNALVPVLIHGDSVLWESNTVLRYLGRVFPAANLYGGTPAELAKVDQWLDWQATTFNNAWAYAFQAMVRQNKEFTNQQAIEKSLADWQQCIAILDELFLKQKYSTGDQFRLSDIALALSIQRWYMTTKSKGAFTHVDRFFEDCRSMKGFDKWVANGVP